MKIILQIEEKEILIDTDKDIYIYKDKEGIKHGPYDFEIDGLMFEVEEIIKSKIKNLLKNAG